MKQSFFDLGTGTTEVKKKAVKKSGCNACRLYKDCDNPYFEPLISDNKKVVLILENPSATEDETGEHLSGESGKWLKAQLEKMGLDLSITYACKCAGNLADENIQACKGRLFRELSEINPRVVIPCGSYAIKAIIGDELSGRISGVEYKKFIGEQIPLNKFWACPVEAHYIAYSQLDKDLTIAKSMLSMIEKAVYLQDEPLPEINPKVKILTEAQAIEFFQRDFDREIYAFDYETTGLKPHADGHELISMSICSGAVSYAFLITEKIKPYLKAWLENENIKKCAHNLMFEDSWSYVRADADIKGWTWDTILGAHCLNNNKPTSQKFLVFSKFGKIYDAEIDQYLQAVPTEVEKYGNNAINKIRSAPVDKLLEYNALDSWYCYKLYEYQKAEFEKLDKKFYQGFKFFVEGAVALAHVHRNPIHLDMSMLYKQQEILTRRIDHYFSKIMESPELKQWKSRQTFNPDSGKDMAQLLYNYLGYEKPGKKSRGSSEQETDEKALEAIGTEFTKNVLQYRKLKKIRDTYIGQFLREQVDGKMYPVFSIHIPKSFRSSGQNPNLQNIPKRDPEAKKRARTLIKPSPGNKLAEYDYKSVEVAVSACVHKDKNMIAYVTDSKNDMHRDTAADLFMRKPADVQKAERQLAKNGFVFPSFYGSTSKATGPALWDEIEKSPELKKVLREKKITNFEKFQNHVKKVEDIFWNERFAEYQAWKERSWKLYQKRGYVDLYTGFRSQGPMSFTELINREIQGPAFHCLLWTLINVQAELDKGKCPRSKIIGQVHDSLVCDIHPDEELEFDGLVKKYAMEKIREHWDWIIVPLTIEKEVGTIDGDWTTLKEVKF